jgi:beta-lactamase class A
VAGERHPESDDARVGALRHVLPLPLRSSLAVVLVGVASVLGCKPGGSTASEPLKSAAAGTGSLAPLAALPALEPLQLRLDELAATAGGQVGIVVLHVESGRSVTVGGERWLPLQSVYKLPLAVAVAKEVQAGRVSWDQSVTVTEADRVPGALVNQEQWKELPRAVRVLQLLEYSLVQSDNIASEKLVTLIGGPGALTAQMRSLGFEERGLEERGLEERGLEERVPDKRGLEGAEGLPHHAPALPIARLLAGLQRGDVLPSAQREVLWEMMRRARTGERRIRAGVPVGTPVLEKTGTGRNGSVTNDVGLITLPGDAGHLALVVLLSGSSLPPDAQEDLIAEIARAAFNATLPSR